MTRRDLDSLLQHLQRKLAPFVGTEAAFQVKIHGKGSSVQVEVTEVSNLQSGQVTLDERQR